MRIFENQQSKIVDAAVSNKWLMKPPEMLESGSFLIVQDEQGEATMLDLTVLESFPLGERPSEKK